MSTYFNITFEFNKGSTAIIDSYNALIRSGLVFKCGCFECENDTFEDIVNWNQSKLNENFVLGYTEHPSHDYKQMCFEYSDFSEVRLYIMNDKKSSTFTLKLIIPEKDLGEYNEEHSEGKINYIWIQKVEKMEQLKQLAKKIWKYSKVLTIQTGWELSDEPPKYADISIKNPIQAEPFSIIPSVKYYKQWGMKASCIERDGIFLENEEATNDWINAIKKQ